MPAEKVKRKNRLYTMLYQVVPSTTQSAHLVPSGSLKAGGTSDVNEVAEVGKRELFCMISKVTFEDKAKSQ